MDSKRCTKCNTTKLLVDFNKRTDRIGAYESHCKKCRSEYRREKYLADPEKYKARWRVSAQKKRCNPDFHIARKKYLQENKQEIAIQKAEYRSLNRDRFRQWAQSDRDALKDSYVKSLLKEKVCKSSHIPNELIALYRENLRITRFIKEQGIQA